ncbi:hypothetical protein VINI7043_26265 [Vibrio nigripulchritudo ATCC 27043]|uniref:hypothetical protein n=1 Tax=Vibrio nigripulchritudo TaxID=28173 RepID=UPI00021C2E81|nr:hypothetical protein [Vibrio nigripulchritudo]EGU49883.1 hypothetical protein VINI7043_26265 [Vibrio nigripulchritudo ATCC 27043]
MKKLLFTLLLIASSASYADWHHGKIEMIAIGYDGKTISIGQAGSTKTNCTCYPTWPNRYCLNRDRISFNEEYALLLAAKSRGQSVALNIDETTCQVIAMYEN